MKTNKKIIMVGALAMALTVNVFGQTNLQFTAATATDEQAIRLTWASQSNHVYQIQFADALATNANGSTTWNILYDDYPAQGTNTFWLDTGNYFDLPVTPHPKNKPMRFYRILDKGLDDLTNDEPTVSIVAPTNGTVVTGNLTISVTASTDQARVDTKLYVDGQEMWPSDDSSNYVINTCEWENGTHTIFATAKSLSLLPGPFGTPAPMVGHAVSPFVQVIFSNLVTRISFSQPYFNPDAGQTQQVSAVFTANSDWTLNIIDVSSNVVKTATGSGTSMLYNWDGTDNSNNPVVAGVYYYLISAQTNGESGESMMSESMATSSMYSSEDSSQWYVTPSDGSGGIVPLALYPPGLINTNDYYVFQASPSDVRPQHSSSMVMGSSFSSDSSSSSDGPSSQDASAAPTRPPTAPMARLAGTFGVAFQLYMGNGSSGYQPTLPKDNSSGLNTFVKIEGQGTANPPTYYPLTDGDSECFRFIGEMQKGGWSMNYFKHDDGLSITSLRGSGTPFNGVNLGFLFLHGAYGTSQDFTAGGCKQMYFPIASGGGSQYLRMSEMNFGGAGTNGLKWMVLATCRSLYHVNWSSMQSQSIHPYNSNLHLLLGLDTEYNVEPRIGAKFADYILFKSPSSSTPMKLREAWPQAARDAYVEASQFGVTPSVNPINFAVAGDGNCWDDTLRTNLPPTGSWTYSSTQVYP